MGIAQDARMLSATMPNVWDNAERFIPYFRDGETPIDRPERVTIQAVSPSADLYPDCPLCGDSIVLCDCGPDEKGDALWAAYLARRDAA